MLVTTMEIWPHGYGVGKKMVGTLLIANVTQYLDSYPTINGETCHYAYYLHSPQSEFGDETSIKGLVLNYNRRQPAYKLVTEVFGHIEIDMSDMYKETAKYTQDEIVFMGKIAPVFEKYVKQLNGPEF